MQALRFFNVISDGEFEQHKGGMKSPTAWMKDQLDTFNQIYLFDGSDNVKRDFIHVDAVIEMALDIMPPNIDGFTTQGIFNIGTGESKSFKDVAEAMIDNNKAGKIEYVPMPEKVAKGYQQYTCADMSNYADRVEAGKAPPQDVHPVERMEKNSKISDNSNAPKHVLK
jgi:ADP-L-glycero-D-manno-heptose 6-epimerase